MENERDPTTEDDASNQMTDPNNETEGRYFTSSVKKAKDQQTEQNESASREKQQPGKQGEFDQGHSSEKKRSEHARRPPLEVNK